MRLVGSALLVLFLVSAAHADDFSIKFKDKDLDFVMGALAERPFKEVAPLLMNMQQQINTQQALKAAPPKKEEPNGEKQQ